MILAHGNTADFPRTGSQRRVMLAVPIRSGDIVLILIALDGSATTGKTIDYVVRHPGLFGAAPRLTCLFVEAPVPLRAVGALGADPGMPATTPGEPALHAHEWIEPLRAAGYAVELEVREGVPGVEIAQFARDGGYDLVVLGSRGRGLFRRCPLGPVARKLLSDCEVPVLLVH